MKIRDPFLLALLEGGRVELHELPKPPPRPPTPADPPRKADHFPMDADYQITYDRGDD
jgi:hypothetical protein